MKLKVDTERASLGGALGYMAFGFGMMFFLCLILVGGVIHAANPPKVGDIIPCDSLCTVQEKNVVLDSLGLYDCSVKCTNGNTYGIDCENYGIFPNKGETLWVRMVSVRMRSGSTIDSWLNVTASSTDVQNACVITGGEVELMKEEPNEDCLSRSGLSQPWVETARKTPGTNDMFCYINETLGFPLGKSV